MRSIGTRDLLAAAVAAASALAPGLGVAQTAAVLFKDADLALGRRLIQEHRCTECHRGKVGGNGAAMYGRSGRITTPGLLRGMVEQCNTELKLGLFPEEVTAVAAVINREHYRFD